MFDMNLEKGKTMDEQTFALSDWDPFSIKRSDWFDPEWMFGIKSGFDVVIANPPYINILNIKNAITKRYISPIPSIYTFIVVSYIRYVNIKHIGVKIPNSFIVCQAS